MMRSLRVHAVVGFICSLLFVCGSPAYAANTATIGLPEGDPAGVRCPEGYLAGFAIWYDNSMSGLQPYCVRMLPNGDWEGGARILDLMMSDALPGGHRVDMFCPRDSYVFGFKGHSHVYGIHSIMQLTLTCRNAKTGALTAFGTRKPDGVSLTEWPDVQCKEDSVANGVIGATANNYTLIQFGLSCAQTRPHTRTLVQPAGTTALDTPRIEAAQRPAQGTPVAEASRTRGQQVDKIAAKPLPQPPPSVQATQVAQASRSRGQLNQADEATPQAPPPPEVEKSAPPKIDPAAPVILNPQPLPPKATAVLKPRPPVLVQQGQTQTRQAATPNAAEQPILGTQQAGQNRATVAQILCRGGNTMRLEEMSEEVARALGRTNTKGLATYTLIFGTSEGTASADGSGLQASTCGFVGQVWKAGDPPAIRFVVDPRGPFFNNEAPRVNEKPGSRPHYLDRPDHYWLFAVRPDQGFYEAVSHEMLKPAPVAKKAATAGEAIQAKPSKAAEGAAAASPKEASASGLPKNLFDMDDRAIIVIGGKQTTAGKLKAELRAAMRQETGAPQSVKTASRIGELQIAGTAVPTVSSKQLAPAAVSQSSIQHAQVATTRSAGGGESFTPGQSQTIQGTAAGNRASSLEVDCTSQVPRIVQVRGAVKAGETFTIEGSCFGRESGSVELIGLPSGKVTTPFTAWSEGSIAAMMPPVRGVQDQRLAMTVIRKADRKTSPAREVTFVAAKGVVPVPSDRWSPSARFVKSQVRYDVEERDWLGHPTPEYGTGRMQPGIAQVRAQINPACALDAMGATPNSGGVRRIVGWENGPPHQADVSLEWYPGCTIRTESSRVTSEMWRTYICEIDFTVNATAYCPIGIDP